MLMIRLARTGAKKQPFYHVTVAEKAARRDGRFVERVGFFNPVARGADERLRLDLARIEHWLSVGARPSERVRDLISEWKRHDGAPPQAERSDPRLDTSRAPEASAAPPATGAAAADASASEGEAAGASGDEAGGAEDAKTE